MRRDFTKKNAKKRAWQKRFGFMSLLGLIAAVFFCSFITFNFVKKHWQTPAYISAYITRFNTWVAERKHHLNPVTKVKQIAMDKTNEQEPIHFEFYSALPNMQVSVPGSIMQSLETNGEKASEQKETHKVTNTNAFMSAEQLEKEFAREIKSDKHQKKLAQKKVK